MKITPWELPVVASWARALDLKELLFASGRLILLLEEEQGNTWRLTFKTVQAFRTTTEECAAPLIGKIPINGGLFEVHDSPWVKELGNAPFLAKSRHYIVCCYDEVVEAVATDFEVTPAQIKK